MSLLLWICFVFLSLSVSARPASYTSSELPRLALYFQTTHDHQGHPISMLPLITEKGIALTHLIVSSIHIDSNGPIHLNDHLPSDPMYYTLWNETQLMRAAGVTVMGMVGGAARGSFAKTTLDGDTATFEWYYAQLHDVVVRYDLQGLDLDVEQFMSQFGIERLVMRLRADFGDEFVISLAPVASALQRSQKGVYKANLSGFSYTLLEATAGSEVSFYNAQFYNGFGSLATPADFNEIVRSGWPPNKVLLGQVTAPANGGSGFVPFELINATIIALRNTYDSALGGVMGWEYFNSLPGGTSAPWEWAQEMTRILRPGLTPTLRLTEQDAYTLEAAWQQSVVRDGSPATIETNVDYMAMVNVE